MKITEDRRVRKVLHSLSNSGCKEGGEKAQNFSVGLEGNSQSRRKGETSSTIKLSLSLLRENHADKKRSGKDPITAVRDLKTNRIKE